MARVTVEDCLKNVKNRFELVLVAAKRAREIMLTGSEPNVTWDNDKPTVVALREVAKGDVTAKILDSEVAPPAEPEIVLEIPQVESVEVETEAGNNDELLVVASEATPESELPPKSE